MQLRPYGQPAAGGQVSNSNKNKNNNNNNNLPQVAIIIIIIIIIVIIIIIDNLPQVARSASLCPRASQM